MPMIGAPGLLWICCINDLGYRECLMSADFDLLVIGGGINGAGIANLAAQSGLVVLLVEQDDLAAHTSSQSSKLIHGGLRYLEFGELRLVREALAEREVLLAMAPHLVRPLTFVLPVGALSRPAWMIGAGLFVYDHLGRRKTLAKCRRLNLRRDPLGRNLAPGLNAGFSYSDCAVDDARLVVLNAMQAEEYGASILPQRAQPERARAGERHRSVGGAPGGRIAARGAAGGAASGQGQPYRGAAPLSGRSGLYPAAG
jgi:glycerol-3-phosphate dehydrogenase